MIRGNLWHQNLIPLSRDELIRMRAKAIRRGVWFRMLTRSERAQIDLTVKVVKKIRSFLLARVLASLVKKLREAMETMVVRMRRVVASPLAKKLSRIALSWGNKSAAKWPKDFGFLRYLTIMCLNNFCSGFEA